MSAKHRSERLVPFTDAVVAIAITLLVLPLVDIANQAVEQQQALPALLSESVVPLIGFAVSFFVIARLWWAHHQLFEHVETWTSGMVVVNVLWLFTIVLLPWATVLSTSYRSNAVVSLLYIGDMTLASALQTVLARLILRGEQEPDVPSKERFYGNLTSLVAFVAALAISVAIPQTYDWPLLLLAFTGLVDRRVHRRLVQQASGGAE